MDDNGFDWGTFLRRWQDEWVPSEDEAMELEEEEGETALSDLAALGAPPASEAEVADAERRLGTRLPPSYREFLLASNGWSLRDDSIYQLGAAHEIGWFGDPFGMTPMYRENLDERSTEQEVLLAGMWQRALQLETDSDMSYVLLDPGDTDEHGEWALYVYKGWSGEYPDRYPSFRAYMQRRYESFHSERARLPEFANDTTRARDADVARAREEALSGRWEAARELLEVARRYGRPGAWGMLGQLDVLSRGVSGGGMFFGDLVADPRCADELVPVMALARVRDSRPHPGGHQFPLGAETDDAVRAAADAILAQVRDGSYRYAPGGDFGQAVAEAREAARWGDTDGAWRVIRAALSSWSPPVPQLMAPLGLLADPVLGPVVTRERGRELLATPRAGRAGVAPEPVPDLDPPGLSWLAEAQRWNAPYGSYRCLWVEGVEPEALPGLVGQNAGAGLTAPPVRPAGWFPHDVRRQRDDSAPWEDRAVVGVGRTGSGWAFGFDPAAGVRGPGRLFVSPAIEASRGGGRAVVLWIRRGRDDLPALFHLSVAERGEELYAYTLRGTDVERSGPVPEALDPARVLSGGDDTDRERRLLTALEREFGLALPRHALAEGILPELTTRSWNRAPREGEVFAYATISVGRPRT
ncbi:MULTISPECIES: SMI1/KNR4 family protein [unclassified Streptomyces]|uniref:SMI1/KNR4 family protein n=1 Tax=unclassified Streptomyces TaxID=2593676 RepID=UPI00037BCEB3|nr:SMI1/KNR4 family protein [Streptomyces sp. SID8376]WSB87225.1 SMI1/KNR4 family protein [Streptomyces cellulosae]WSB93898.1 SMI1/KNR4 family protein [Streptomyces cellulosae]